MKIEIGGAEEGLTRSEPIYLDKTFHQQHIFGIWRVTA